MAGASHRTIVGRHLLVIVDHRVVGFASFGPARDSDAACDIGQLYAINLDPDVWGRGLGRALLNVTDRLRELGYVEAVLWVVPDNQRARRLHESEGWGDDDLRRDTRCSVSSCRRCAIDGSSSSGPASQTRHPNSELPSDQREVRRRASGQADDAADGHHERHERRHRRGLD